jgi:ParB family chromosome partitioning protein
MTETTTQPDFTLEHVNPAQLSIGDNVRDGARLSKEFLASVKEHGVLNPITAVRMDDGTITVRDGQRRTEAARQVGLDSIPAVIHAAAGDDKTQRTQRVVQQIVLNDQRSALTDAERARGINQLLLDGVSPTKVAKNLSTTRTTVDAARTAGTSAPAMSALDAGQLSLAEAVVFVEFDEDPEDQAELLEVAGTGQFQHRAEQLRADRAERQQRAEAAEQWAAKGYRVLEDRPDWHDPEILRLSCLRTEDDERVGVEFVEQADPQHWAVYLRREDIYADRQSGDEVLRKEIDWDTADDPTLAAEEGYRHFSTVVEATTWRPEYYCIDPGGAGLTAPYAPGARTDPGRDDDVELDEASLERERLEQAEREREERRRVVGLNKLGAAAATVRQTWVRELLTRKTAPKGTALFVAQALSKRPGLIDEYHGKIAAADLLGCSTAETPAVLVEALPESGDGRAVVVLLGLVLGAMEARTPKDAWRHPSEVSRSYLDFLTTNDYTLAAIEEVIVGTRTADALYETLAQE